MISKKYSLILVALICFVLLNTGTALAAIYSGGSGTIVDPFNLSTDSDIDTLSTDFGNWSSYFILTNNITLEGNHTPIGNSSTQFTGDFDGNGYVIKNLTIYETTNDYAGFFGYVSANIHDIGIETSSEGVVSVSSSAGILVGYSDGTISNCYATGNITGQNEVGGLVGYSYSTINNCYATGNVTATDSFPAGGLVGWNLGTISNCYATGTVIGSSLVGGLVGTNDGTVANSYATGNVTATDSSSAGGLIGQNLSGTVNDYCYYSSTGSNYNDVGKSTSYVNFTNLNFISGNSGLNWNANITAADDSNYIWKIIDGYTLPFFQWQDTPEPLAPYVESLSPSSGNNNTDSSTAFWINITGCSFNITDTVFVNLTMDGQDVITGTIDSNTYTTINATFDLTQAIEGDWSLYVTNPDEQISTAKTFTVESIAIPSAPEGFTNTTGNFWVNHSWNADTSGTTDSYNISYDGGWDNGTTNNYYNQTSGLSAHAWSNITVYAYNATDSTLSEGVSDKVQIPNNDVTILDVADITVNEGKNITIDINSTDADGDSPTYSCNRTDLFTDFNTSTGEGTWQTNYTSSGTYSVNFSVSDGYDSTASQVVTITVTNIPTTMYVGSSGYDYETIQGAINDVDDGDTIIVTNGIYTENVVVNKSIILRSENGAETTTVIASDSTDPVFDITADNVTIDGFNITGASGGHGIKLSTSDNNTLENNIINNNDNGISVYTSNNNTLTDNIIKKNTNDGIYIERSTNNILTENNVSENGDDGISLYHSDNNNTLTDNIANGNVESGIQLSGSNNTIIADNIVNGNGESGIDLGYSSNNNTVENNIAYENSIVGISIQSSISNTLENNTANNNNYFGIFLDASSNTLGNNTVMSNTEYDIVTIGANEIKDLEITDNSARVSFLSDGIQTGIKGNVTNSTSLSGKTNVNGYLTVKRGGVVVKSADVGVTREDPTLDITISYDDSGMSSSGESSIDLYKYNTSTWIAVSGTSLDTSSNQLTATLSEGTFGLFKDPETSSSSSSSSDSGSVATRVRSQGTISTLPTNSNGEVTGNTVVKSKDTITALTLYKGTVGTDASGNPVNKIIVTTPASMPADTPKEVLESGLYYDFGPSGTTFSQDVLITIDFNPEEYEGKNPVIYTYSEENGWIALETTVDWESGRATAYTNHFSLYALFGDEGEEVVEEESSEVSAEFSEPVEDDIETPTEDEGGFGYIFLVLGIVVIAAIGYIVVKNKEGEGGL